MFGHMTCCWLFRKCTEAAWWFLLFCFETLKCRFIMLQTVKGVVHPWTEPFLLVQKSPLRSRPWGRSFRVLTRRLSERLCSVSNTKCCMSSWGRGIISVTWKLASVQGPITRSRTWQNFELGHINGPVQNFGPPARNLGPLRAEFSWRFGVKTSLSRNAPWLKRHRLGRNVPGLKSKRTHQYANNCYC